MEQSARADAELTEQISLAVLAEAVPRDVIDEVLAEHHLLAGRSDGKLPPHAVVYLLMLLALHADDDYEEAAARLTDSLRALGQVGWRPPTASAITQARRRLGEQAVAEIFARVARPVADIGTPGAWMGGIRLVSIDGTTFDLPDTKANVEAFGKSANAAFPKARLLTLMECGTHAHLAAALGGGVGKGSGERSLAKELMRHLQPGMLLILDAGFYGFDLWRTAQATGAQLLWRLGEGTELATVATLPDGSYTALVFAPYVPRRERTRLAAAARAGEPVPAERARLVRVVEYEVDNRGEKGKKELICLITTLTSHAEHPAPLLAHTYHSRWEHEQGIGQVKTHLRGSGTVLRSKSPQLVRQEIHGYLLTHYALTALICRAADAAGIEPTRVKFARTVRVVRRRVTDPAAFSP